MRRFAWLCVALFLALSVSGSGHTAFAASDPAPTPEDFAGEYSCTTISLYLSDYHFFAQFLICVAYQRFCRRDVS